METAQVILFVLRNFRAIIKLVLWLLVFLILSVAMMAYGISIIFGNYDVTNPRNPVFAGGYSFPLGVPFRYTSLFGEDRGDNFHEGVDMAVPIGSPLYAVKDGVINYLSTEGNGGIAIGIMGDDGRWYYYAHLNEYAPGIKEGMMVSSGQVIGYSGNTGRSTGPHLHFGIKEGGRWIDPLPFLNQIEKLFAGRKKLMFKTF
ncbi:Peptidase family M23 (plasmid) [Carboxydocella thermautotrophica]|nr:Peptidase family M23 [Carboxydocella thermautotrophica]